MTSTNQNQPIGIIGAMPSEVALLRQSMEIAETGEQAGMTFLKGTIGGFPAVLVQCGVGKVNAAIAAQILISCYGVRALINTGAAGALDERLNLGDIVISADAVQHDMDASPMGVGKGVNPSLGYAEFRADEGLVRTAAAAAEKVLAGRSRVYTGRICSGDQFISGTEQKKAIIKVFDGMCCEMEGAAVAQVCALNRIPFVIIRAISDKADGSAEMDYPTFEAQVSRYSAEIVLDMVKTVS